MPAGTCARLPVEKTDRLGSTPASFSGKVHSGPHAGQVEQLLSFRLYVMMAVAILFAAPLAVHFVSTVTPGGHADAAAPAPDAPPAPDDASPPVSPPPAPPQQAPVADALADAAPTLDPQGIAPSAVPDPVVSYRNPGTAAPALAASPPSGNDGPATPLVVIDPPPPPPRDMVPASARF